MLELGIGELARGAAFLSKGVLLGASLSLLRALRRDGPAPPLRAAWQVHVGEAWVVFLLSAVLEALQVAIGLFPARAGALQGVRDGLFLPMYLFASTVGALAGALTLALLGRTLAVRRGGVILSGGVALLGLALALGGATAEWSALFGGTRILTVLRVLAYLGVWVALLTGRLHPVDPFLVAYLAVATCFSLLLPLQETVFGLFAWREGLAFWTVNQLLQTLLCLGGALAMGRLAARLRGGTPPDLLLPGETQRPWALGG